MITLTREISVDEFITKFRDPERIGALCRECPSYGSTWACPPFDHDVEAEIGQWSRAFIVACRFDLGQEPVAVELSRDIVAEKCAILEPAMLSLEKRYGGRAFSFCGSCRRCRRCSRTQRKPCIAPAAVRPSLEAYGFDLVKTLGELFGEKMLWAADGFMPRQLTLVSALFHNSSVTPTDFYYLCES